MNQQQNMQNQGQVMNQPPNMLTTKDHLYITDMLSWNLLAMKKANHWAGECQDQEVLTAIEQAGQMHQQHYQKILSHLETSNMNTQQMSGMSTQQQ